MKRKKDCGENVEEMNLNTKVYFLFMQTGYSDLPLHYGKCPPWLFEKMKKLSRAIYDVIERDFGREEFLRRLADPFWFHAFGCVLGFDWHSSGLTTTVCGALKEALDPECGIVVLGGKGKTSRKTPDEIRQVGEKWNMSTSKIESLVYASRASAKVDNSLIQDGYELYHHSFVMAEDGKWAVVQQGLNDINQYARRYHWLSDDVKNFVVEPHSAICCDKREEKVLNMIAKESEGARKASVDLVKDKSFNQLTLSEYGFVLPKKHEINKRLYKKLIDLSEFQPRNYEELIMFEGVGPKTVRALALLSELIYGEKPSWKDPVKFSFSHGGKDGFPYFVDESLMDKSIEILENSIEEAKIGKDEKMKALSRLKNIIPK